MSRGDKTKNVRLLFNSLLSLRSQRKERENKEEKCLSFLKKNIVSFSLSFSSAVFLFLWYVLQAVDSFFFSSLLHFFLFLGWTQSVGLLSLFPLFSGRSETTSSVCLSLSLSLLRRERFGKPDLPFEYSAAHKKREGSSLRKKSRLARESRKKKMDWMSPLIAARTAATQRRRSRQRRKRTHPREQIYVTLRPPPRGMPPKFILPLLL